MSNRNARRLVIGVAGLAVAVTAACGRPGPSGLEPRRSPSEGGAVSRVSRPRLIYRPAGGRSAQNPAFSPNGRTILFTMFHEGYDDGPAGLYALLPDGAGDASRVAKILDEPGQDSVNLPGSVWNRLTRRITFASDRRDGDEIWTARPNGKGLLRVTRHRGSANFIEPSFSPDGRWIVFESDTDAREDERRGSILKVRVGGARPRLLVRRGAELDDRQPNWSPAGDRVLFQRRRVGSDDWDIYTVHSDGSGLRRVTRTASSETDASWSPNGKWICYSSDYGNLPAANIFVVPAAGGRPIRVTRSDKYEHGAPSWSPGGRWIAFESHPAGEETAPASLWRVRAPALK